MRSQDLIPFDNPFNLLQRFTTDMEQLFARVAAGGRLAPALGATPLPQWNPAVDVIEKDNTLAIRADLPGMTRGDVSVEVAGDVLTIKGERKTDVEETRDGVYRQERTYGSFLRTFPLPEQVKTDDIKATFTNGVLEVMVPLPAAKAVMRRRIDVVEPAGAKAKTAA